MQRQHFVHLVGACPGVPVALSVELVHADEALDYALLKLPSDGAEIAQTYGYLRLKSRAGVVGEQLYIPQHPLYEGKRIALVDDFTNHVALLSLSSSSCGGVGYSYSGDTQSGSSGSPVLSFSDHGVVALHHCGEMCGNTCIPAVSIVADLKANGIDIAAFDGWTMDQTPSPMPSDSQSTHLQHRRRSCHSNRVCRWMGPLSSHLGRLLLIPWSSL